MFQGLDKLLVSRRVALIVLLFAVPLSALSLWLVTKGINGYIAFARQELRGDAVQRPLEQLLQSAGRAHLRATDVAGDDPAALDAALDAGFRDLDAALATHGEALQVTTAGLASRHRENFAPAAIRDRWRATAGHPSADATAALMADLRGLITHVGDTSNLILDPDLDSYYLMDVTLCVLPEVQERIATVTGRFAPALRSGALDGAARQAAAVQAALLREANVARIDGDVQTVLNEDPNFYGVSPTLAPNLPPALAAWHRAVDALLAQLDGAAAGDTAVTAATLTAAGRAAHDASFVFWQSAATELDQLLARRIAAHAADRRASLLWLVVLLAAAAGVTWRIARGLNRQLRDLSRTLTENARELDGLARTVSESSGGLAGGATAQAASLEEISASIEEISSMSKTNADSVDRTKELADGMRAAAESGSRDVTAMAQAMSDIQVASDNISKIIKAIDEIAFQTNILALNAAVEAARAGEAGAGFAVVADEVRSLAQRATGAARETAERIDACIAKSRDGAAITQKVTTGFADITTKAREVNSLVTQITGSTKEQSAGLSQVNQALAGLDKVTQQNAAMSEEASASAQELSGRARQLDHAALALVNVIERHQPLPSAVETPRADAAIRAGPLLRKPEPVVVAA